ncbi:MAG: orotidine-5'-phosphate decarboxylase [Candidatus Micrarchaeota archaeon]|nr:orotidine-5'-phosphate decarboxylase [Candidatus Micrarchaeota archaeon]MDE1847789.1 orotidine-5'-phosphate decarboxylase [Candidatus Micrarchaeota archaeon]MDE1864227.1 orotidine-5'-phosphate decarboxylase [Candidatus Micrarchaeota archaeon]
MRNKNFARNMVESAKESKSRLIFAADVDNAADAKAILKNHGPNLAAVKLHDAYISGWNMSPSEAVSMIKDTKDINPKIQVIIDAKLADIDKSNAKKAEYYFSQGFDAIISHGFQGAPAVKAAVDVADKSGKGVLLLMSMTTPENLFTLEITAALSYMAKSLDVDGVVSPGNKPDITSLVREDLGKNTLIFSPGIGVQGGGVESAVKAGTDFAIIGRSIFDSQSPSQAISDFNMRLNQALRDRDS